ncbi:MAG: isoleucine--tRNA ligase [Verrucomicrobiia bacterium]
MSVNYKDTLNLPQTDFPMKANLPTQEPKWLETWQKENLYQEILKRRKEGERFILHDGPPFANGDAHMGHALNMTLKDIVLKSRNMAGYFAPFIPGWDCHGLPIEHKVMKEMGAKMDIDPVSIRKKCAAYAEKYINIQREQFQRLGVFGDWQNPYLTMAPEYEAEILRLFAKLVRKNLVYQTLKPDYWSTGCQTALAEAEVEYQDREDQAIYVKFPLADDVSQKTFFVIWTTTPWTLPANLAVAVHPELSYVTVKYNSENLVISRSSWLDLELKLKTKLELVEEKKGQEWVGITYRHPFLNRESKVVAAKFVTADSGSGLVHVAPGHGQDDYQVGLKEKLEILSPVDDRGRFTEECGVKDWVGKYVFDANPVIVESLKQQGSLLAEEILTHSYPHCWRSKTPIVFRSVKQWFIRVDDFRQKALDLIDQVKWIPDWGINRIRGAVESRPDWCISRQRTWGVPIPVFYQEKGDAILSPEVIEKFADLVEKQGTNLWFEMSGDELAVKLGLEKGLKKGADTLDVWIDSGSSHAAVLRKEGCFPADLYLEGSDQHRGWFQSSLLTSAAATGEAPYRQVLTNGFVVDLDGKKLSKSNAYQKPVDLMFFVNKSGADILRLWVASQDFRDDVPFSEEIFSRVTDTYRTIRNTLRILLANLYDFDSKTDVLPYEKLTLLDQYILVSIKQLIETCLKAYNRYEFHEVYHAVNRFCAVQLSSFYIDVTKDRMYCDQANSSRRRATQTTMHEVASVLCRLLAPLMPFTTDEAWRVLGNSESVHLSQFPEVKSYPNEDFIFGEWPKLLSVRDAINAKLEALRSQKNIGKSLEAQASLGRNLGLDIFESVWTEVMNVSQVIQTDGDTKEVEKAVGNSCARCWKILPEVGTSEKHPELCHRCEEAVETFLAQ